MANQTLFLKEWLKDKLSAILKFQIPDEMADQLLCIKSDNEINTHLKNLLDYNDFQSRKFINEFIQRRHFLNSELTSLKKSDVEDDKYSLKNPKARIKKDGNINTNNDEKADVSPKKKTFEEESNTKKKKKFVNLYSKGNITALLKGRYLCNCEAKRHTLVNNCLSCGRIVCEQEGSGPCFVCDTLVCTPEEQQIFNGDAGKASKLYEHLLTQQKPKGLEEAIKERNKLLEYDRNCKRQTHVFDDDSDYFCSTNPWLTLEERETYKTKEEEFYSKKNESRRNKKITLKFDNTDLKMVEINEREDPSQLKENDCLVNSGNKKNNASEMKIQLDNIDRLVDPFFMNIDVKFKKILTKEKNGNLSNSSDISINRIMDNELYKLKDEGYCLSIHQPWASFLVHGIRIGEGRTWYTSYRGTLWIASTGVRISRADALKQENTYRLIIGEIKFPADYPPNCLLGCVDLLDCLTQEQYRVEFPNGEIEDPYVFICDNFQVLPVRYPIKGQPNIYKLDEKIHVAAKTCLKTVEKVLSESENKVKSLRP